MLSSLGHHFLIYKCRSLYMIIVSLKEYSCFAKMVCQSLKNVNKELPYDPKIPLLDIHWRVVVVVVESFSHVRLWQPHGLVARQAPLSMGFSRQEYLSGLPCPPPGNLPDSGIEPTFLWLLNCRWVLYCWATGRIRRSPEEHVTTLKWGRWKTYPVSIFIYLTKGNPGKDNTFLPICIWELLF